MKQYIKIIGGLFFSSLLFTNCEDLKFGDDFLDKPITTDLNIDTIFSHKLYAEQFLAEAYISLPDFLPKDKIRGWSMLEGLTDLADCVVDGSLGKTYYAGNVTPSTSLDQMPYRLDETIIRYDSPMGGIRVANIILENIDRVPDMTADEKNIRKAEAKVIIALHYLQMLRYYGGMPWIDKVFTPNDKIELERMTVEEHVNKIVTLCDEAASVLPWNVSQEDEGRMNAAAALAIKSRTLLFAASPLFNSDTPFELGDASEKLYTWYGNKDNGRWQDALDASLEFLRKNKENSDYYKMVDTGNPRDDYKAGYFNRCNREVILPSHRFTKINDQWYQSQHVLKWGWTVPAAVYADMFEWKDGTPFSWDNPKHAANPFFENGDNSKLNRDPRLYENLLVNGDKFRGRTAEIYKTGRESWEGNSQTLSKGTYNGYGLRKFVLDFDTELFGKFYQCPLIRLPEIYLNIAEAMNELGKAEEKDEFGNDAYDYIDMVRNRVDMPKLDREKCPVGEKLREAILHERAVEFGFEEIRYFDIVRWKRNDLLVTERFRLKAYKDGNTFRYERDNDVYHKNRMWAENWSNKYFLLPIPADEINKKYGLVQNPGW